MGAHVNTEHFLHTVIQIRGETEYGWITGKKNKIYSKPLGKLKLLWIKLYFCCMCCLHICCRRRGKVKGDRLIPEVASASASAISAEQRADCLSVLPFICLTFKLWGQTVDSKQRSRWGNLLLLLHNLLLGFDWIIHFMQLSPWIGLLKWFVFYKSLRIFQPGLSYLLSWSHSLYFPLICLFLLALLHILKDKEIWFY